MTLMQLPLTLHSSDSRFRRRIVWWTHRFSLPCLSSHSLPNSTLHIDYFIKTSLTLLNCSNPGRVIASRTNAAAAVQLTSFRLLLFRDSWPAFIPLEQRCVTFGESVAPQPFLLQYAVFWPWLLATPSLASSSRTATEFQTPAIRTKSGSPSDIRVFSNEVLSTLLGWISPGAERVTFCRTLSYIVEVILQECLPSSFLILPAFLPYSDPWMHLFLLLPSFHSQATWPPASAVVYEVTPKTIGLPRLALLLSQPLIGTEWIN